MKIGDMIQLCEDPWHQHAGDCVIVTKIDDDGQGFDFVIPETRGHSPMKFASKSLGNFDLNKLGVKGNRCRICQKPILTGCVLCDTCPSSSLAHN